MSTGVREFLQNKDKDFSRYIPDSYKMTPDQKRNDLFLAT